jgi:hypothetical protein
MRLKIIPILILRICSTVYSEDLKLPIGDQMKTKEYLVHLLAGDISIELNGKCHDCGDPVSIDVEIYENILEVSKPFWHMESIGDFCKCEKCYDKEPNLTNYQPCEVYSRVVGYLRPVKQYNIGKQEEFHQRVNFKL